MATAQERPRTHTTGHLRVNEPLAVGSAVVTGAGALAVELLIHGVVSSDTEPVSRSTVRQALSSALNRLCPDVLVKLKVGNLVVGASLRDEKYTGLLVQEALQYLEPGADVYFA